MMPDVQINTALRTNIHRMVWQVIGGTALIFGAIGIVLPLLPTTPFVILAAFAFAKGSPAVHARLIRSKTFGPMIADWQARGAIARRYKMIAVLMMGGAFAVSVLLQMSSTVLLIQAACIGAAAAFVLSRPDS